MTKKLKIKSELVLVKLRNVAIFSIALFSVFAISFVFSMIYMFF